MVIRVQESEILLFNNNNVLLYPGRGTPYKSLQICIWEGFNQDGTFSRLQVYAGVGISLVLVYERLGNLSLWSVKRANRYTLWL